MFPKLDIHEFKEIIELFNKDAESEINAYLDMGRLFINSEENELMVRFNPVTKSIIIARIQFNHTRMGYGSSFLSLIKEYGRKNGYHTIIMESILTKDSYEFVMKKGFERMGEMVLEPDSPFFFFGNYKLDM